MRLGVYKTIFLHSFCFLFQADTSATLSGQYVNPISLNRRSLLQHHQDYFLSQDNLLIQQDLSAARQPSQVSPHESSGSSLHGSCSAQTCGSLLAKASSLLLSQDSLLLDNNTLSASMARRQLPALPAGPRRLYSGPRQAATLAAKGGRWRKESKGAELMEAGAGTRGRRGVNLVLLRPKSIEGGLWANPSCVPSVGKYDE